MSQKLIVGILGAVIVVGGGAWYYQTNIGKTDEATSSKSSSREKSTEKEGGMFDSLKSTAGSFADILSGGDAQECQFSGNDPETKEYIEGTVFIDGQNFRMNADTKIEGKDANINIIQNRMVMYMWSDDEKAMPALMIDMSAFEGMEGAEKPKSPIDWLKDPEAGVDYDCRGWSPRSNSFEPPEDIKFMDMFGGMGAMSSGMMQEGMTEEGGGGTDDWNF